MPGIDGRRAGSVLVGLMLAGLIVGPASAQTSQGRLQGLKLSGDQPIQIESDKLEVREKDSMAIFSGNVTVVQGPTLLKAGKMTVYYAKDGGGSATTGSANIDRLEVDGKVFVKSETQTATGDRGTFDMKTEILTLSGKEVVLSEGGNVLTGCELKVDMKSGLAELGACGGRVKTLLTPNQQSQ
ncbi:MAG: LptA/OstA family protein [Mesorhizobium sp.]|jgi:lipopolysaccharide export system protein LptA